MGKTFAWVCPRCRGKLDPGPERWRCRGCGRDFEALLGIPDLRTRDDIYMDNARDRVIAQRLLDNYDRRDFRGLLEQYFDLVGNVPDDLRRRQVTHILTAPGRARHWLDALGGAPDGLLLDLGCGSGSFLAAVGRDLPTPPVGVDIALRWLIVARKRLDEAGLGHVPLVCAGAEDLPVADGSVAGIVAGDVIEHVGDQAATLAEAHRVLRTGGRLFVASPNRYSLAPEPHVGVWGVGYLPRPWMEPYVRRMRKLDFRAIHTLGYGEWWQLLRFSPFEDGRIVVPMLPPDDLDHFGTVKRHVARAYTAVVGTRLGQMVGRAVGPLFHIVCEKTPTRPSTRAIRQRSRRSVTSG